MVNEYTHPSHPDIIKCLKWVLVQGHIEHCLDDAIGPLALDQQRCADEFKAIARYL
jgi:hypothetical protein